MKKRVLPVLTAVLISTLLCTPALAEPDTTPAPTSTSKPINWDQFAPGGTLFPDKIEAPSAVLIDASTGTVLFGKDADSRHYPASITKIMTCLLAIERWGDLQEPVIVGELPDLGDSDAVSFGLETGETISMQSLLYLIMLPSANDAANAIAVAIAGSVDRFVTMMNNRAKELGMTGTHYTDTNGLAFDTDHYTTAADMAKLARAAMQYPVFREIAAAQSYEVPATNKRKAEVVTNTNHLLDPTMGQDFYEYATGIKTGFTGLALNTLVSSATKDGRTLIAVTMDEVDRESIWSDSITMFEYGFKFYNTVNLSTLLEGKTLALPVRGAADDDQGHGSLELSIKPKGDAYITDRTDFLQKLGNDPLALKHKMSITTDAAPIILGEVLGTITYSHDGTDVLTCDLIATRDVALATPEPTPSPVPTVISPAPTEKSAVTGTAAPAAGSGTATVVVITVGGLLAVLLVIALLVWGLRAGRRRNIKRSRAGMPE